MKFILGIVILFLGTCIGLDQKYKFKNCTDISCLDYKYEVLKKVQLEDSLYEAYIIINYSNCDTVSYDLIACIAIDIYKKENIIHAHFYRNIYVNASYSGTEDGSSSYPFNTFMEGYNALLPSGTLRIAPGNYTLGNNVINKRMTIMPNGGDLTIGF